MNIYRYRYKLKKRIRKYSQYIKNNIQNPRLLYPTYVVFVSLFCVFAAQLSHGSSLRVWLYEMFHDEVIEKGIQSPDVTLSDDYGTMLSKYRFLSFGETNPAEVDADAPMVALTFDDGPSPEVTKRILDVLEDNYSHATFFVVGTNAEKYPETLESIAAAGCELGNHTYEHKDLTTLEADQLEDQIHQVNRAVNKATGADTTVVRPPFGAYDDNVLEKLQVPVVLWDLDTEDWDSRNAQMIVDNVMKQVKDGDIILMHDIYDSTAEAVEILVPRLKEEGYQVLSVSEMAHYKGKDLECHKAYGKIEGVTE